MHSCIIVGVPFQLLIYNSKYDSVGAGILDSACHIPKSSDNAHSCSDLIVLNIHATGDNSCKLKKKKAITGKIYFFKTWQISNYHIAILNY